METMVIDTKTAEVELFSTKEQAEQFIKDNNLSKDVYIIMPCIEVNDKEDVELVIYENCNNNNIFGSVADYQENVFNSDFIDTPNEPIKYMYACDFLKYTFIDDLEKMVDLLQAIMEDDNIQAYDDFLKSYSYLTKNELDDTIKAINTCTLAELYRQAENYYIEELNGRPTGLAITSDIAKEVIGNYVYNSGMLSIPQQKEFEEICASMGC